MINLLQQKNYKFKSISGVNLGSKTKIIEANIKIFEVNIKNICKKKAPDDDLLAQKSSKCK